MPLDDVWKTFQRTVGIYSKGSFEDIAPVPGVYAWFYPLRVLSEDLKEFLEEVRSVHLYDARTEKHPTVADSARLGWFLLRWHTSLDDPPSVLSASVTDAWEQIKKDPAAFDDLRRVFLRASLLMPPLYVGKATNLRNRCFQHLKGRSQFTVRFEARADFLGLNARRVKDLLLVTLETEEIARDGVESELLVEEILKCVARPPYGIL